MNLSVITSSVVMIFATWLALFPASGFAADVVNMPPPEPYCQWKVDNYAIKKPLCGYVGDAKRGKAIASNGSIGNCLACHQLPIDGVEAYGTIGPPLEGVGTRMSEGFIRLRVVDTRNISPMSIMPGFYRDPKLINRPGKAFAGRTFLTAQQVEDVIAYLVSLK